MPPSPAQFAADAQAALPQLLARLQQLVEQESPTDRPDLVNAANDLVQQWAIQDCKAIPLRTPRPGFGDLLQLQFGDRTPATRQQPILLLGHLDTVWAAGTLAHMPFYQAAATPQSPEGPLDSLAGPLDTPGSRLHGPGIVDMKAGVLMALTACALLHRHGITRPVTLLLNPDEEVGSPVSRAFTERLALGASAVLVLEPAQGLSCKTARKGIGDYTLTVHGVAAHAGVDFTSGHSAILELAHQIRHISTFTDLDRGLTVNPGTITGGTRSNVIADRAQCTFDVRIARASDATEIDHLFRTLRPRDPACRLELSGGLNRPPMERSPGTVHLFEHAQSLAARLGPGAAFDLTEAATGGGSDGNFTAALGIPTLDGLGAVGAGAHAAHEHILPEHLAPRTALLAALLATLP